MGPVSPPSNERVSVWIADSAMPSPFELLKPQNTCPQMGRRRKNKLTLPKTKGRKPKPSDQQEHEPRAIQNRHTAAQPERDLRAQKNHRPPHEKGPAARAQRHRAPPRAAKTQPKRTTDGQQTSGDTTRPTPHDDQKTPATFLKTGQVHHKAGQFSKKLRRPISGFCRPFFLAAFWKNWPALF